jgi:hypothetical protein
MKTHPILRTARSLTASTNRRSGAEICAQLGKSRALSDEEIATISD